MISFIQMIGLVLVVLGLVGLVFLMRAKQAKICLNKKYWFYADVSDNCLKKMLGLMFRTEMPDGYGMLFYMEGEKGTFWMRNVNFPLELIGVKNGKVVEVIDMEPCKNKECVKYQTKTLDYAIEVKKGFCEKHNVEKGSAFELKL